MERRAAGEAQCVATCWFMIIFAVVTVNAHTDSLGDDLGGLSTDKTLVMNEGEGTLDVLDEGLVYDHAGLVESCQHRASAGDSTFETVCYPIGRLILFPEEHSKSAPDISAAELLRRGDLDQLRDAVGNLVGQMDTGIDGDGDPVGGGGDGKLTPDELANRVYAVMRTWQYELDRIWALQIDKNNDGLVEFLEVSPTGVSEETSALLNRFNFADSNKDGYLSETDVGPFRNPLWFSRMHQWALGALTLEFNSKKGVSDNISRAEYTVPDHPGMPYSWEIGVPTYVKAREFDRLDVDQTGSLDLREAARIPEIRLASIITLGVQSLLHACDSDGDGALDSAEVEKQAGLFAEAPPLPLKGLPEDEMDTTDDVDHEEL